MEKVFGKNKERYIPNIVYIYIYIYTFKVIF